MLRVPALLCISLAMQTAAIAQDANEAKQDTVQVHGKALQLSCAEWKRNQDGSWTSIGALLVGSDTLNNVTLRGAETKVLQEKCEPGSTPAAAPAQSRESTRHTKRRNSRSRSCQRNVGARQSRSHLGRTVAVIVSNALCLLAMTIPSEGNAL